MPDPDIEIVEEDEDDDVVVQSPTSEADENAASGAEAETISALRARIDEQSKLLSAVASRPSYTPAPTRVDAPAPQPEFDPDKFAKELEEEFATLGPGKPLTNLAMKLNNAVRSNLLEPQAIERGQDALDNFQERQESKNVLYPTINPAFEKLVKERGGKQLFLGDRAAVKQRIKSLWDEAAGQVAQESALKQYHEDNERATKKREEPPKMTGSAKGSGAGNTKSAVRIPRTVVLQAKQSGYNTPAELLEYWEMVKPYYEGTTE